MCTEYIGTNGNNATLLCVARWPALVHVRVMALTASGAYVLMGGHERPHTATTTAGPELPWAVTCRNRRRWATTGGHGRQRVAASGNGRSCASAYGHVQPRAATGDHGDRERARTAAIEHGRSRANTQITCLNCQNVYNKCPINAQEVSRSVEKVSKTFPRSF